MWKWWSYKMMSIASWNQFSFLCLAKSSKWIEFWNLPSLEADRDPLVMVWPCSEDRPLVTLESALCSSGIGVAQRDGVVGVGDGCWGDFDSSGAPSSDCWSESSRDMSTSSAFGDLGELSLEEGLSFFVWTLEGIFLLRWMWAASQFGNEWGHFMNGQAYILKGGRSAPAFLGIGLALKYVVVSRGVIIIAMMTLPSYFPPVSKCTMYSFCHMAMWQDHKIA